MRGVNNRRQSESQEQPDIEHETIESLVQALSSVSSSSAGLAHSPSSSNSSAASLSLNFTVPMPDSHLHVPIAKRRKDRAAVGSCGAAPGTRAYRQRLQTSHLQASIDAMPSTHPAPPETFWPSRSSAVSPKSGKTTPRRPRDPRFQRLPTYKPPAPASRVWHAATGQPNPRGDSCVSQTACDGSWSSACAVLSASARLSAAHGISLPLPQQGPPWRGNTAGTHVLSPGRRGSSMCISAQSAQPHSQWPPSAAAPAVTQRRLAAIRTCPVPAATPSVAQLTELGDVMDEIIARMAASVQAEPMEPGEPLCVRCRCAQLQQPW